MKTSLSTLLILSFTSSLMGCSGDSSSENSSGTATLKGVRELQFDNDSCEAAGLNDNGEVLLNCLEVTDGPPIARLEILSQKDERRVILEVRGMLYVFRAFGNDGSTIVRIASSFPDQLATGHYLVNNGNLKPINSYSGYSMSSNGRFIGVDPGPGSSEIVVYSDGEYKVVGQAPDGIAVSMPMSVNDSGDVVGGAGIGTDQSTFTTSFGYKVVDGKFELLSFADRPDLSITSPASINNLGNILVQYETGTNAQGPIDLPFPAQNFIKILNNGESQLLPIGNEDRIKIAEKLNDNDLVLGYFVKTDAHLDYFIFDRGNQLIKLDPIIPLGADEYISEARLNNKNQILVLTWFQALRKVGRAFLVQL